MPNYFSKLVDRYFNQWISRPTWDSTHPLDTQRFYQFIKALKRYSRKHWLVNLHENILKAAKDKHPELNEDHVIEMADTFLGRAQDIFYYESAPFPDPIVEMRNPYQVSSHLRRYQKVDKEGNPRPLYTSEEIEEILTKNFGRDWRSEKRWKT